MNLDRVTSGHNVPHEINVIIEIPAHSDPVKYEVDKETGAVFVDRFMNTAMHHPCNDGYVPHTLSEDGDPVDVLVVTPVPLIPGPVVRRRPVGILKMTGESGPHTKVLAVPIDKLCVPFRELQDPSHMPPMDQTARFFEHYKDLEPDKWVRLEGRPGAEAAKAEIRAGVERFQRAPEKPAF